MTAKHKYANVPDHWIRKQTLANAERYVTEELKELETKVLQAEAAIQDIEERIFHQMIARINRNIEEIQTNCRLIAGLDCLLSFATQAKLYHYSMPHFNDDGIIEITQGRHPIIEVMLGHEKKYIPNDLYLDQQSQQIIILTGPNMAGKSAVLRQTGSPSH